MLYGRAGGIFVRHFWRSSPIKYGEGRSKNIKPYRNIKQPLFLQHSLSNQRMLTTAAIAIPAAGTAGWLCFITRVKQQMW